MIGAVIFL